MQSNVAFVVGLLLLSGLNVAVAAHWSYPNLDADEGFPQWGGLCDTGTRQSPIDLSISGSLKGVFDELQFENFNEEQTGVKMINNGHSIQLYGFAKEMKLKGGPLLSEYVVEQLHLHWWSEHTINKVRYPLEVHIVNRNTRYPNMSVAINNKDGLAVIGLLYHVSNTRNEAIDQIKDHLKDVGDVNQLVRMKQPFVVSHLFPELHDYMTYDGSLTTPSCAEVVTWIVLTETMPVTLEQVNSFKEVRSENSKALKNNYRNLQNANNRPVVVMFHKSDARTLHISRGTLLFVLVAGKLLQSTGTHRF